MCSECRQLKCPSGCPNAFEEDELYYSEIEDMESMKELCIRNRTTITSKRKLDESINVTYLESFIG